MKTMKNNVLVTGMPRSGTSVTMRILQALGYTRLGNKHVRHCDPQFNPDGYEELNEEDYIPAMQSLIDGKGYCVKVFGVFINMVAPSSVDKVIMCTRDMEQAVLSTQEMFRGTAKLEWYGKKYTFTGTRKEAESTIINNMFGAEKWLKFHKKGYHVSKLEYLKANPGQAIEELVKYLGEGNNIQSAIALVRGQKCQDIAING